MERKEIKEYPGLRRAKGPKQSLKQPAGRHFSHSLSYRKDNLWGLCVLYGKKLSTDTEGCVDPPVARGSRLKPKTLDRMGEKRDISTVTDASNPVGSGCPAVKDHSRAFGEFLYVYPVISRRSRGLSIGVNLNPDKVCNFNCIYCEVDRITPPRTRQLELPRLAEELEVILRMALNGELKQVPKFQNVEHQIATTINDIAFSGDGEPTMCPQFSQCVQLVADLKKKLGLDSTKIVLITNGAGLDKADVKKGLEIMDANNGEIWGKMDAGTEDYYKLVNRSFIRLDRLWKNLMETGRVRPIIIQSLFLKVHDRVIEKAELEAYCQQLRKMLLAGARIKSVHAYTVARPTPEAYAAALAERELEEIAGFIERTTGIRVETFA